MRRERDNYQIMAQTVPAALLGEATAPDNRTQLVQIIGIILKLKGYILGFLQQIRDGFCWFNMTPKLLKLMITGRKAYLYWKEQSEQQRTEGESVHTAPCK